MWVDVDDGIPTFNTATGRKKPANLENDPRISLLVIDPQDAYKWVAVDGKAELTTDGADQQIDRLAKKYRARTSTRTGGKASSVSGPDHPEHVTASGRRR